MEAIKFIFGLIFAAIGGLFLGQIAFLLSVIVVQITREIFGEKDGSKLAAGVVVAALYLTPLIYLGDMLLENWHLLIGALVSYIYLINLVYVSKK